MSTLCWDRVKKILSKNTLKSLSITNTDPRYEATTNLCDLLMRLSPDTLQELSLFNVTMSDNFNNFFTRQASLKNLAIKGPVQPNLFRNLDLASLKLVGPKSNNLKEIIASQPNLKSFQLTIDAETTYDERVFEEICSLPMVEKLDIPFGSNMMAVTMSRLNNLSNLQKLSINCTLLSFAFLASNNSLSLTDLDVSIVEVVPRELILQMRTNYPNLKSLKFKSPLAANYLSDFGEHFKKLESLCVETEESYFVNSVQIHVINGVRENLRHLAVINHDRKVVLYSNDLTRFIKNFSNLKSLVLIKILEIRLKDLKTILTSAPLLEEIVIQSQYFTSTTTVMNSLKKFGSHLKLVKLENFKCDCDVNSLKIFFGEIFPVIEKKDGSLILRDHGKFHLKKFL